MFHTRHFAASCYPHTRKPGNITMENAVGTEAMDDLRRRGIGLKKRRTGVWAG
jgi:hypothetical protein